MGVKGLIRGGLELGWQGIVTGKLSPQVILTDHLNCISPDTFSHGVFKMKLF